MRTFHINLFDSHETRLYALWLYIVFDWLMVEGFTNGGIKHVRVMSLFDEADELKVCNSYSMLLCQVLIKNKSIK